MVCSNSQCYHRFLKKIKFWPPHLAIYKQDPDFLGRPPSSLSGRKFWFLTLEAWSLTRPGGQLSSAQDQEGLTKQLWCAVRTFCSYWTIKQFLWEARSDKHPENFWKTRCPGLDNFFFGRKRVEASPISGRKHQEVSWQNFGKLTIFLGIRDWRNNSGS